MTQHPMASQQVSPAPVRRPWFEAPEAAAQAGAQSRTIPNSICSDRGCESCAQRPRAQVRHHQPIAPTAKGVVAAVFSLLRSIIGKPGEKR